MFNLINQYIGYIVLVIVLGVGGFVWYQSERIDALKHKTATLEQKVTDQSNEIESLRSDFKGLQDLDSGRQSNRAELQDLRNKVSKLSETDAKKDTKVAEAQINETINMLINDISEATK